MKGEERGEGGGGGREEERGTGNDNHGGIFVKGFI